MKLINSDVDFDKYLIFLNNKLCRLAVAANDEEGWIDTWDIKAAAPIEENNGDVGNSSDVTVRESMPLIRKYGKVRFKKIK